MIFNLKYRLALLTVTTCLLFTMCSKKENPDLTTVEDIDGNVYNVVKIGNQYWMKENLKVSKYKNGDIVQNVESDISWEGLTVGARCYYDNDANNNTIYGTLYNWYAINDTRGLCPSGWHVPSDSEWRELFDFLGGLFTAGGKMKSINFWEDPNTGATNESEFTALPGGGRDIGEQGGGFESIASQSMWWGSDEKDDNLGYSFGLDKNSTNVGWYFYPKKAGFSCRCIKD